MSLAYLTRRVVLDASLTWCLTLIQSQGEAGKGAASSPYSSDQAIKDFEKKFKDKTKNNWADRDNFVAQKGKYTLIEVDGDADAEIKVTAGPV